MPDESADGVFEPESGLTRGPPIPPAPAVPPRFAAGEKGKARDLIAAVRTLHAVERDRRPPTADEQQALANFPGFGPVALSLFPDPATARCKDAGWQALGDELQALLSAEEYAAAKRSTFTAFYTAPVVIHSVYAALDRLGVPPDARLLEPGCGSGNFLALAPAAMHATGVELDPTSARIAQARHPRHTVRAGDFRDTPLPAAFDAAVGNVPFADLRTEYAGHRLALHDLFLVKALDALAPGGVLAAVTSRYTLDKRSAAARELMGARADFLGAIRLPSDAFKAEGTAVVTDLVVFRKRAPGEAAAHVSDDWLATAPLALDGATVAVNRYFVTHPEVVLGNWSRQDTLYGTDGLSVTPTGELADRLPAAAFGEVVDAMEVAPDGSSLRPRSRFAKFVNLPELQQMFRRFADVQTADMLDLPRPALEGGKPQVVACPMSDAQADLQRGLIERYDKLRSQRIDPREDNALAVTTDGRKLALDPRLFDPAAPDDPASKLNALVENVHRVWRDSTPTKGAQLVFCDLGVRPTAWGFSVYDEVVKKLTACGIPAGEIACMGKPSRTRRSRRCSSGCGPGGCGCCSAARRRWGRGRTCGRGWSPCTTWTPRGSRPRWSSGRAASSGRGTRTPKWRCTAT